MAGHPILPYVKGLSSVNEVSHLMKERDEILGVLKANLLTTRSKWSNMPMLNDRRCSLMYMIRFMWRCPYRQSSLNRFKHPKLAPRFIGPFMIVEKIGPVANRLALPKESLIHPVFHVSVLRKAVDSNMPLLPIPKDLTADLSTLCNCLR